MKKDKTLIAIAALVVILLVVSFFISGDDKKNTESKENYQKEEKVAEEKEEVEKTDDEENSESSTSTKDQVVGIDSILSPLLPTPVSSNSPIRVAQNPKPTLKHTWRPADKNSEGSVTPVSERKVYEVLENARIQYTHDSKILIDVKDSADSERLRYANTNADPIAILSEKYGLSTKEILRITKISYKDLDRENASLIGDIVAADTYVSGGNTLIAVKDDKAVYYFWNKESNVYTAAKEASQHMRKNVSQFWDKFFVK